ncbi:dna-Directed DNA polymerase [Arthrobacter sp. Hiyo8]|nr:dna-Directed DNA polymerase [Arthrobacter sp. Hiyo8]
MASRSEAFTAILTSHSRYFVQHYAPDPALAVELVRAAGGVPSSRIRWPRPAAGWSGNGPTGK